MRGYEMDGQLRAEFKREREVFYKRLPKHPHDRGLLDMQSETFFWKEWCMRFYDELRNTKEHD